MHVCRVMRPFNTDSNKGARKGVYAASWLMAVLVLVWPFVTPCYNIGSMDGSKPMEMVITLDSRGLLFGCCYS